MKLRWANRAKDDLVEIRRYSIERWGREVAKQYLMDLRSVAVSVADNSRRTKPLRGPWRYVVARSHVLVCLQNEKTDTLTIARVLHGAMDITRHLPRTPPDLE